MGSQLNKTPRGSQTSGHPRSEVTQRDRPHPVDPLGELPRDIDRAFESIFGAGATTGFQDFPAPPPSFTPRVDVRETDTEVEVKADLPGVDCKDVKVEVADGHLLLSGEKRDEKEENKDGWHVTERTYGSFRRTVALPPYIDWDKCKAAIQDGVLTVTLPKTGEARKARKSIEIT